MKLTISDGAAKSFIVLAVTARIISGIAIDMPELYCASWMSALLGGMLALPMAFSVAQLRARCQESPIQCLSAANQWLARLLALVLAAVAAFDTTVTVRRICHSVDYIDLGMLPQWMLLVSQLLLGLWALWRNGDAIGFAARLWNRLLFLLLVIVLVLQWKEYRPAWLTPILGDGIGSILDGALRVAGWLSLGIGLLLFSTRESNGSKRALHPVRLVLLCAGISALLLLIHNMMTPPLIYGNLSFRYFQLDALLSNGRTGLSLQFPVLVIWFISLLTLLLFDSFICASMLQVCFPKARGGVCILLTAALTAILLKCNVYSQRNVLFVSRWMFAIQTTVLLFTMLEIYRKREGTAHA